MNDIVERLISLAEKDRSFCANVLYEAADEITQLREDLEDAGNGDSWKDEAKDTNEELENLRQMTTVEALQEIIGEFLTRQEQMGITEAEYLTDILSKHLAEKINE